jgi:AbiV family abortive infection protein
MVTEQSLLEGSWLALAQAARLLRSAGVVLQSGDPSSAVVLGMLGREEMGRSRLLRDLSGEVSAGKTLSVNEVARRCGGHVDKQSAAALSIMLRGAAAKQATPQSVKAKAKRQPQDRHDARKDSLYVDLKASGKDWNRPMDVTDEQARDHLTEAINDYANAWDQLVVMGLTPGAHPHTRGPAMHAALGKMSRPVELIGPVELWRTIGIK